MAPHTAIIANNDNPAKKLAAQEPYVYAEHLSREGEWQMLWDHLAGYADFLQAQDDKLQAVLDHPGRCPRYIELHFILMGQINTCHTAMEMLNKHIHDRDYMNNAREGLETVWRLMAGRYNSAVLIKELEAIFALTINPLPRQLH